MTTPDLTPEELREAAQRARESVDSWPSFLFDRAAHELERLRTQVAELKDQRAESDSLAADAEARLRAAPSSTVGERTEPRVPSDLIQLISAYGDARADGVLAGDALAAVIKALRKWGAGMSQAAAQTEPAPVGKMTAQRAKFFLMRFKHEEKLLGPNEQAGLDYAIAALEREQYGQSNPPAQGLGGQEG